MADNKTKPTELSVTAFIDALTNETRRADAQVLRLLAEFGVVGIMCVWVATLLALRRDRSTARS